jgi:uncharacterized protein HemX
MPQLPRVRMPKVSLPGRPRRLTATRGRTETASTPKQAEKPAEKPPAKKPAAAAKAAPADPNLQERMAGLQGWMAEIERRQGRLMYFGGAALVIAILAAGAALYFGLTAKSDSASKSNVDEIKTKVDQLQAAATKSSKDTQQALNASAAQLQASIAALQKQQAQNAANISTLQGQVASGAAGKGAAGTTITPVTPSTTTTTPKKP